ncbi:hypothetical protein QAD02_013125 [Eretmocerus hayati]|uniref:Uncharacterized protein n=1 Tax=Eretmocerus hayati TaxID=131215 RepID=A0ACC2P2K7_9HYME|nr:hypothetical protein QAD02_013125 [Eretmocerus hayati]
MTISECYHSIDDFQVYFVSDVDKLFFANHLSPSTAFQKVAAELLGYSQSSACLIIRRVSTALAELFHQYIHFPRTEQKQLLNTQEMYLIGGRPHVAAAIDGILVKIDCPYLWIGETFCCWKDYFALNVMASDLGNLMCMSCYDSITGNDCLQSAVGPRGRMCNMDVRLIGSMYMIKLLLTEVVLRVFASCFQRHRAQNGLV